MAIPSTLDDLLARIGLPKHARTTYFFLLEHGPSTRQRLLRDIRLAPESIAAALDLLQLLFLVQRQVFRNKDRFYATHPNIAWRWQELEAVWSQQLTLGPVEDAPVLDLVPAEERRRLMPQIREVCLRVYKAWPYASVTIARNRSYADAHEYAFACAEAILLAQEQVVSLHRPPSLPHVALFWSAILDRRAAGVCFTRCITLGEMFKHGLSIVRRDVDDIGITTFVIERDDIWKSVYIVDDQYVLARTGTDAPVGLLIRNADMIRRYLARTQKVVARGIASSVALDFARKWAADAIDAVRRERGSRAAELVERVTEAGAFTDLGTQDRQLAEQLVQAGVFRALEGGRYALVEPPEASLASLR